MALGFADLEKAFDTVPREMVMATLRWMGIPEAEVRMVEGTYEKTTARVVVAEGTSRHNYFQFDSLVVNIAVTYYTTKPLYSSTHNVLLPEHNFCITCGRRVHHV